MRRFLNLTFAFLVVGSLSLTAQGAPKEPAESQAETQPESQPADPEVTITPPKSYTARKFYLFPLETPYYVMRGVTYPIAQLGKFIERKHIARKAYDFFSNDEHTLFVYPIFFAGGGEGFGGGLGLTHRDLFHKGYHLNARYMIFTDLDQRAALTFSHPNFAYVGNRALSFSLGAHFRRDQDDQFYGIGPKTLKSNESLFGFNREWFGGSLGYELSSSLTLTGHLNFDTADTGPGKVGGPHPSVETVFDPATLPGFNQRISYLDFGLQLAHDTRDETLSPQRGGLRSFTFSRFQGLNQGGFNFNQYELDLRQYIDLGRPHHVLALRNDWVFQQGDVPFNRLAVLDIKHGLRSFHRGRFRDTSSVVFSAEYRYPVWDYIEGSVFVDTGRVFDGPSHFSFKDFKYSVGGGIRILLKYFTVFTIQGAYGNDGAAFIIRAGSPL